jgi:hemolysin D
MISLNINGWVTGLFERAARRLERRDAREFLPAALEVVETPPSPAARVVAYTVVLFAAIALAWAFIGKVDIIATAPGRVLPTGRVKQVQPMDTGAVVAIHVQDGDRVKAGQLLIELDPTTTAADSTMVSDGLVQAELDVARLIALKAMGEGGRGPANLAPPASATPAQLAQARATMRAQADQQTAKLADFDEQIAAKSAEVAQSAATVAKVQASIPILSEKERMRRDLQAKGYGTTFALLDAQQSLSEARLELEVQAQRGAQAQATKAALLKQRREAGSQFVAAVLTDLAKAEQRRKELSQEFVKAKTRSSRTQLRAPVDGTVEQLAINTVGGVVTPAQRLLTIVPDRQQLVIDAELANRDVGFVRPGQIVDIKVETFTFTRYGLLKGRVVRVSRDVVAADRSPEAVDSPAERAMRPPGYIARIVLDSTSMMINGERESLQPGMAVTAEIKTGRRTIIDYLLSPLAKRTSESLRER